MDSKTLNKIKWYARRGLAQLTWPWLVACGLLAFFIGFYFSLVEPARDEAAAMRHKLLALQQEISSGKHLNARMKEVSVSTRLVTFYKLFPPESSLPDWMEKILAVAVKNELTLRHGEYQVSRDKSGKLLRYQVTLPVKGTYLKIRGFIDGVLTEVPIASLDNVKFERQKIGDVVVEATVLLTIYLGRES